MTRSLADILDAGPTPADPPEEDDWALLDELERAVLALSERLRYEPGLSLAAAPLFCKLETNVPGIAFRSVVWPQARRTPFRELAVAALWRWDAVQVFC